MPSASPIKRRIWLPWFFTATRSSWWLAHYIGLPLDSFQKLAVATGSVSILVIGKSGGHLIALNLRPPFELKG